MNPANALQHRTPSPSLAIGTDTPCRSFAISIPTDRKSTLRFSPMARPAKLRATSSASSPPRQSRRRGEAARADCAGQPDLHRPELPPPRGRSKCPIPEFPVVFMKSTTALQHPGDPILLLANCEATRWTTSASWRSLSGKRCKNVPRARAMEHVLGYTAPTT